MITSVNVQKPAYREILESRAPYVGVFLLKDEPSTDLKSEKSTGCLTGKDLLNRLHQVGTLAGIVDDNGGDMIAGHELVGHGRLRITEMVNEDPLIVKVDHLKDKPYSKADGPNLPTALDLLSTISMNRVPFIELIRRFDFSRLADHGAAISNGANNLQLQEVLAELNVHKRLKLALDLVKEQTDFTRL
ncbi:unnamed protein product [Linum trigynum]|uniref:Lon N-terminal domain-containing protein n=1 Tax=Linum trigynum TaxID=586398 RepID=A0AAV2GA19_9ROSI